MMTTFTIGYCVTLPLYGHLSDTHGRLRPLVAAYATFSIGCALCGVGQQYWQVILGRIITGCGASGIVSLASIIIADIAAPSNVAVLRSYVNIATVIGLSLGGPLGGILSGTIGWKWSFIGQVPLAVLCCLFIARGLRQNLTKIKDGERQLEEATRELKPSILSFDFTGAITLAIWISSFLAVIDLQNQLSWGHPLVLGIAAVGSLSFVAFAALESYPGNRELLIPLRLLKTEIGAFCLAQVSTRLIPRSFVSQIPPYFANSQGYSDAKAGGQTVPASIGTAVGALVAGQLIKRFGRYKMITLIFLSLYIVNQLVILFQWSSHPISPWEGLTTLPTGIFGGLVLSANFIGLYSFTPRKHMATAISMYYMSQQIGIAMGIALSSSLLKRRFEAVLNKNLTGIP
ncbi:major facilitator superfamily domain-containing protein, partial [Calycina marina]